jgi:hypothetical protein
MLQAQLVLWVDHFRGIFGVFAYVVVKNGVFVILAASE